MTNKSKQEPIEGELTNQEAVAQVSNISDLVLVVSGQVVESNLADVAKQITANIDAIPEVLETDQDFENAEKVAKSLRSAKKQLVARRDEALKAAEELNAEFELIRQIEDKCSTKALTLEKLVRDEKKRKREQMVDESYADCARHYDKHMDESDDFKLARPEIEYFDIQSHAAVIKGCSSWASMQDRLDKRVEQIKVMIDNAFNSIASNAAAIDATQLPALFQDRKNLLLMDSEHLGSEIRARVATHEAAEAKKAAEAEATAAKIAAMTVTIEQDGNYDVYVEGEQPRRQFLKQGETIVAEKLVLVAEKVEADKENVGSPVEAVDIEHTELAHSDLMPPFEPNDQPEAVNPAVIDNAPPFGNKPQEAVADSDVHRSLEIRLTVTATIERAKQIASMAHGRFKNMPEVHRVGLVDPDKKHNAIMDMLNEELNKAGQEANAERRDGIAAAIHIIEQVRGI